MDPSSLLQRLVQRGTLATAQARWVEEQAAAGAGTVEELLLRFDLVRGEDIANPSSIDSPELAAASEAHQRCERMMKAIFELCVARGTIDEAEYLARLREADDLEEDDKVVLPTDDPE